MCWTLAEAAGAPARGPQEHGTGQERDRSEDDGHGLLASYGGLEFSPRLVQSRAACGTKRPRESLVQERDGSLRITGVQGLGRATQQGKVNVFLVLALQRSVESGRRILGVAPHLGSAIACWARIRDG